MWERLSAVTVGPVVSVLVQYAAWKIAVYFVEHICNETKGIIVNTNIFHGKTSCTLYFSCVELHLLASFDSELNMKMSLARTFWMGSATSSLLAQDYAERDSKSGSLCGQDGGANPLQIQVVFLFCVAQIFVMLLTGTLSGERLNLFCT